MSWANWAGNQTAEPAQEVHPSDEAELAAAVKSAAAAGQRVKAVGAGHSCTGIALTDGVALMLDRYRRVLTVDRDSRLVTVQAGIGLHELSAVLAGHGLALANLGDIDVPSVGGAISTGTHGTGLSFGGLATQVRALSMVLADGSLLETSATEEPEVFAAARVGLGALGVISTVTLQAEPAFTLAAVEEPMRWDTVLADFPAMAEANEHAEFYWFPHTDDTITKRNNRTERPAPLSAFATWFGDEFLSNTVFGLTCRLGRRLPAAIPTINKIAARALGTRRFADRSDRVLTSPRRVRFTEMEYAVPRAELAGVLTRIRGLIEDRGWRVSFPLGVRVAAPDDVWLSTAYDRESGYVALRLFRGTELAEYFPAAEEILVAAGGRPHWGKLHTLDAAALRKCYPRFTDVVALRDRLDPQHRFANAYLDRVLGP
ncbi:MAG: D-arabinono-1,4-lactone oxidase [Mycobacteriales bacterium]